MKEAVESAIFHEVAWQGPLKFEDLMNKLPSYGWNQVFAAVDRLSRKDLLLLRRADRTSYLVALGPRWAEKEMEQFRAQCHQRGAMRCSTCYVSMTKERTYDYSADLEQFFVKSWRCGRCEGQIEEIVRSPSQGRAPKRMRYAVRPWTEPVGAGAA